MPFSIYSWALVFYIELLHFTEKQLGAFGGKVWWQNLRLIHGVIYLFAAWLIHKNYLKQVKCLLIADLLVGLVGFLIHYNINKKNNKKKLNNSSIIKSNNSHQDNIIFF